jgi:hypothetical protein
LKKAFKGVEMTTAKWTMNTGEQQDMLYPGARSNEKGCLQVWGGDALTVGTSKALIPFQPLTYKKRKNCTLALPKVLL